MMEEPRNEANILGSPIQEFFRAKTVFLTGGTGFMGKVLVEKLLRSCPQVARIYILVRQKKNKDYRQRLQAYLEDELFDRVESKNKLKVVAIPGDVSKPGLGMTSEHAVLLAESVHVVFHAAATVRFDEPLPVAVGINVSGTKEIFELARSMKHLKAIVHVSTAFSNCHLKEINEELYDAPTTHEKLIQLTKCLDEKFMDKITPIILENRPNTYVYTKSVAEEIVKTQSKGLPACVFRPAIVVASKTEPVPGWIDNLYGPSGVIVGCGTGVLRTLQCDKDVVANIVPVDLAVNAMIAAAWKTANRAIEDSNQNESEKCENDDLAAAEEPVVYNYESSSQRPITWQNFMDMATLHGSQVPPAQAVWCVCLTMHRSLLLHKIYVVLLHFLPAILMDGVASLFGKRTNMLAVYKKVNKFSDVLAYFTMRDWKFHNDNVQNLWRVLAPQDKELFPFDLSTIEWDAYFHDYVRGVRKYLMKEDPATIPYGRTKFRRFTLLHRGLKLVVAFLLLRFAWYVLSTFLWS